MKTQKLLVIVALVGLMAFFNVLISAQTAQAQPDPAKNLIGFVAKSIRAMGYEVIRVGDKLKIEDQIILELPYTLQDLEDSGIRVRLIHPPPADDNSDELLEFYQLRRCINAANFIYSWQDTSCKIGQDDLGTFLCRIDALLEQVFNDIKCVLAYFDCGTEISCQ